MPLKFSELKHGRVGRGDLVHFMLTDRHPICGAGTNSKGTRRSASLYGYVSHTAAPVTCTKCLTAQARADGAALPVPKENRKLFKVTLPDGRVATRRSHHPYTHVVAVRETAPRRTGWWVEWRSKKGDAVSRAASWLCCPETKRGTIFDTRVLECEEVKE